MATCEADGAPSGRERLAPFHRRFGGALAAQLLALAVAAAGLIGMAVSVEPVKPPVQAAVQTLRPFVSPPQIAEPAAEVARQVDGKRLLQDLLVKAGLRPNFELRRLSWDQARRVNALMPAIQAPDEAEPFHLSTDTKEGRQALHCLTQAAYFEAGANGPEAQAAVVQVVLNRVHHPDFPKSVCGVVYQGSNRETGCQFTFTCDGALDRALDAAAWNRARQVAMRALDGYVMPEVGASIYYHADYVFPTWAPTLVKTATIGPHIFYRMTGDEGSAASLSGRYAGGELKLSKVILRAKDRFGEKRGRTEQAALRQAPVAKGLQVQADRSRRIRSTLAAAKAEATPAPRLEAQAAKPIKAPPVAPANSTAAIGAPETVPAA